MLGTTPIGVRVSRAEPSVVRVWPPRISPAPLLAESEMTVGEK